MSDITLGQFVPGNSCIHRLDPRTKILLMIAYIAMVFVVDSLAMFLVPLFYMGLTLLLAKIPLSYMYKALKPVRLLMVFMFVLNLFVTPGERVLVAWWIVKITEEGLKQAVFITLRLMFLITGTSLMTLTTSPLSLTDGLEKLLSPLKVFKFPAHELAMMMTIALRFIPTLMVKNPDILLLDEPMSNLDARLKLEIRDEIKKIQERLGVTAIIVTHDQEEAMAISSHIAVIDQGALQQYAVPDELYGHPKNLFVASFIGNPPMNFIDGTVEKRGDSFLCHTVAGTLFIPAAHINQEGMTSDKVTLGIRPHNFKVVDGEENALKLGIDYIEHLGKENMYRCYCEKTNIRVITPVSELYRLDQPLYVRPNMDLMNVFDGETQNNITAI